MTHSPPLPLNLEHLAESFAHPTEALSVMESITAKIADWLDAHAAGRLVEFYAPSKSGTAALQNAAAALRMKVGEPAS